MFTEVQTTHDDLTTLALQVIYLLLLYVWPLWSLKSLQHHCRCSAVLETTLITENCIAVFYAFQWCIWNHCLPWVAADVYEHAHTESYLCYCVALAEMRLVRRVPQQWVPRLCAYHSSSQLTSNQLTDASVLIVLIRHSCTLCLAEAISCIVLFHRVNTLVMMTFDRQ